MKYYKHIYLKKLIRSNKLYISKLKAKIYNPRELSSVGIYVIYTGRSSNPRYVRTLDTPLLHSLIV